MHAREAQESVVTAEERLKKAISQLKKLEAEDTAKKNAAQKSAQKKGVKEAKKNKNKKNKKK